MFVQLSQIDMCSLDREIVPFCSFFFHGFEDVYTQKI